MPIAVWLVFFNHLEKSDSQWQGQGLSHILWKIIQMFETTNQQWFRGHERVELTLRKLQLNLAETLRHFDATHT